MKKKIAILGSTGSIGKSLIDIIKRDKKSFEITLLTANKNYKELIKQAKLFNVKNLIITDNNSFFLAKKKFSNKKYNIFNDYKSFKKIFKIKNDFIMSSITGLDGLEPTLSSIKFTKNILIANKEAIICGWNLIEKEMSKHNTNFIPVDSEHFSIWSLLKKNEIKKIDKIFITASGGPFLKLSKKNFSKISVKRALNHPNWKMGKKITIDSATLMNKVFEIIEARNIFKIPYKNLKILIHPKSYVHAIIKFSNGLTKLLIHDTSMKIPIFNALNVDGHEKKIKSKNLDILKMNKLDLSSPDTNRFPLLKILKKLPEKNSLFETILVTVNDEVVKLFLEGKIKFTDIHKIIIKIISEKKYQKYKKKTANKLSKIINLNKFVRLKMKSLSV
jgi:1-deoxy-D-xylulose-5-phosphate reductoisomerase